MKIDSIDPNSHLYELAILATYGDRKNKSTDNLVADLANGTIFQDKTEDVSLLFGLNNGYTKLSNRYKSLVNDNNVKFTLESKLDYYIIESIYQFVFNTSKTSYSFDYIDNWCPTSKLKENVKGYETYNILDTVIIAKKKQTPLDFFLENYSEEIYLKIVSSINQWLPPFSKIDKKEAIQFFEKQLRNALIASVEALQKKIEDECETNYNLKEQERVESYQKKIVKLLLEISDLKEENAKLKNRTELSHITKELQIVDCKIMAEGSENFDPVKVVQESVIETPVIYEVMSLSELKRIAKERKIKGYTKIENKEDLIKLIKKAQLILL